MVTGNMVQRTLHVKRVDERWHRQMRAGGATPYKVGDGLSLKTGSSKCILLKCFFFFPFCFVCLFFNGNKVDWTCLSFNDIWLDLSNFVRPNKQCTGQLGQIYSKLETLFIYTAVNSLKELGPFFFHFFQSYCDFGTRRIVIFFWSSFWNFTP